MLVEKHVRLRLLRRRQTTKKETVLYSPEHEPLQYLHRFKQTRKKSKERMVCTTSFETHIHSMCVLDCISVLKPLSCQISCHQLDCWICFACPKARFPMLRVPKLAARAFGAARASARLAVNRSLSTRGKLYFQSDKAGVNQHRWVYFFKSPGAKEHFEHWTGWHQSKLGLCMTEKHLRRSFWPRRFAGIRWRVLRHRPNWPRGHLFEHIQVTRPIHI